MYRAQSPLRERLELSCALFSCPVVSDSLRPHGLQHTRLPVLHHFLRGSGIHMSALDLLWNLPTTDAQTPHFLRTQFPNAPTAHTPTQPKPSSVCLADWYPETWRPGPLLSCTGCSFLEVPGAAAVWPHTPPRALRPQRPVSTQALYSGGSSRRGAGAEPASAHWHRLAHKVPPIIVLSRQPPTHSVFQERMCLVWSQQGWPADMENRLVVPNTTVWTSSGPVSALRGQGSQELSSQQLVAPRRSRPFPGSVWAPGDAGCLCRPEPHTKFPLWE